MYAVCNWQVLKSSSDDSIIQFEYSMPLSSTDDHRQSVEDPEHGGIEGHTGYGTN